MIRIKSSLFKLHHDFLEADGQSSGSLYTPLWPTRSRFGSSPAAACPTLLFRGRSARIEFEWLTHGGLVSPTRPIFFLMEGSREIARATPPHAALRSWRIDAGNFSGIFKRTTLFTHGVSLLTPDYGSDVEVLCEITPFLALKRSYALTETQGVDELLAPFLFFIAYNTSIA